MKKTVLALALFVASVAQGGTYKCTNAQGSVEFSDKPCIGASVEEMRIRDNRITGARRPGARAESPNVDNLTTSVRAAIARGDFRGARELAVTKEHWSMIQSGEAEAAREQRRKDNHELIQGLLTPRPWK